MQPLTASRPATPSPKKQLAAVLGGCHSNPVSVPTLRSSFPHLAAGLVSLALLLGTFWAYHTSARGLSSQVLRAGRIVLHSPDLRYPAGDQRQNGAAQNIIDGGTNSPAILLWSRTGKAYLLVDLALSHWPGSGTQPPRPRRPLYLQIYNGPCSQCSGSEFRRYNRARQIRVEFYRRKANNPDREYRHMPTRRVRTYNLELADRPGPQTLQLDLPAARTSPGYPEQVYYYVARLTVLSVYPGLKYTDRVALAELIYADTDAALHQPGSFHLWQ